MDFERLFKAVGIASGIIGVVLLLGWLAIFVLTTFGKNGYFALVGTVAFVVLTLVAYNGMGRE